MVTVSDSVLKFDDFGQLAGFFPLFFKKTILKFDLNFVPSKSTLQYAAVAFPLDPGTNCSNLQATVHCRSPPTCKPHSMTSHSGT